MKNEDIRAVYKERMMNPDMLDLLTMFGYGHLPEELQKVSEPFAMLALQLVDGASDDQFTWRALENLLVAKDWAVRAKLFQDEPLSEEEEKELS